MNEHKGSKVASYFVNDSKFNYTDVPWMSMSHVLSNVELFVPYQTNLPSHCWNWHNITSFGCELNYIILTEIVDSRSISSLFQIKTNLRFKIIINLSIYFTGWPWISDWWAMKVGPYYHLLITKIFFKSCYRLAWLLIFYNVTLICGTPIPSTREVLLGKLIHI